MVRKIRIVVVGRIKEGYIREGIDEFLKRLRPFCSIELIELKDKGVIEDSKALLRYVDNNSFLLDVKGKCFGSKDFAEMIKKSESQLTFIIGGAEGTSEDLKKSAKLLSLSSMTFTHELCRLFLVEQVYRSFMIIKGRPYHK